MEYTCLRSYLWFMKIHTWVKTGVKYRGSIVVIRSTPVIRKLISLKDFSIDPSSLKGLLKLSKLICCICLGDKTSGHAK